jgi:hypothetical protein
VKLRDGNETTAYYTDNLETPSIPRLRWPVSELVTAPYRALGAILA